MKRIYIFAFIFILILGLYFRFFNLKDNIIFAYDQARDAQRIMGIVFDRDIKLVGPETDIPGVFNGPLFYYLLLPIYLLFKFDPNVAAALFILINVGSGILIYYISDILFKNKKINLLSMFLWMISYEQLNFSRFISNASPMSFASILFFLGLAIFLFQKKQIGFFISILGLGFAIHFNFYLVYLLTLYPLYYLIYNPKLSLKMILKGIFFLIILLSPFIIAEMKWNFASTKSLLNYFNLQGETVPIINSFSFYIQRFSETIYYSIFSFNGFAGLLFFIFLFYIALTHERKKKELYFIIVWTFSSIFLFGFQSGVFTNQVINSPLFGGITILSAVGISYLLNKKNYLIGIGFLILIIFSNFQLSYKEKFMNIKLFSLQPLILTDQKKLIDYTYKSSGNEKFSICAVNSPLFINTLWSYLYNWYGKQKYGYLPYWSGQKQYFIPSLIPYDTKHVKTRYLIIEPMGGIPSYSKNSIIYLEDKTSKLLEEKKFGNLTVQKRILESNPLNLRDTQNLKPNEIKDIITAIKSDARYSCFNEY